MLMILFSGFTVQTFIELARDWQQYKNNDFLTFQQRVA